jgi:hypothetical protein
MDGRSIEGRWLLGEIPKNYRSRGCNFTIFPAGGYEMQVFTDRGEFRQGFQSREGGIVSVSPIRFQKELSP